LNRSGEWDQSEILYLVGEGAESYMTANFSGVELLEFWREGELTKAWVFTGPGTCIGPEDEDNTPQVPEQPETEAWEPTDPDTPGDPGVPVEPPVEVPTIPAPPTTASGGGGGFAGDGDEENGGGGGGAGGGDPPNRPCPKLPEQATIEIYDVNHDIPKCIPLVFDNQTGKFCIQPNQPQEYEITSCRLRLLDPSDPKRTWRIRVTFNNNEVFSGLMQHTDTIGVMVEDGGELNWGSKGPPLRAFGWAPLGGTVRYKCNFTKKVTDIAGNVVERFDRNAYNAWVRKASSVNKVWNPQMTFPCEPGPECDDPNPPELPVALNDTAMVDFRAVQSDTKGKTIDVLANDTPTNKVEIGGPWVREPYHGTLVKVLQTPQPDNMPYRGETQLKYHKVNYIPHVGYSGTDSFEYFIEDQYGNVSQATVAIVVGENESPGCYDQKLEPPNGGTDFNDSTKLTEDVTIKFYDDYTPGGEPVAEAELSTNNTVTDIKNTISAITGLTCDSVVFTTKYTMEVCLEDVEGDYGITHVEYHLAGTVLPPP